MGEKSEFDELLGFLSDSGRLDIQMLALDQVKGLTGSRDGLETLKPHLEPLAKILCSLLTGKSDLLSKDAAKALVNITADSNSAGELLKADDQLLVTSLWAKVTQEDSDVADQACMALSNLTHDSKSCQLVLSKLEKAGISLEKIVGLFCLQKHNKKGHQLHFLGPFLSNLSQLPETRSLLLARDAVIITRLLSFTDYKESVIRRGGVIGTLRNCCMDPKHHQWLLDESQVDILPKLLLPLAGPTPDCFDPEEIDQLPMDLQYLDDDKEVESDPDLKKMLLESLYQLCATRPCREYIRSKNAYLILRELHKTEKEQDMKDTIEDVVQLLIKKEDEIQVDDLHGVEVPQDVAAQIEEMDNLNLADDKASVN